MHFMLFGIAHVLIVAVVAFFVLFVASKESGFVRLLGNVLGYLLLIVAVLAIVCHVLGAFGINPCPWGGPNGPHAMMMHHGWAAEPAAPAPKK